MPEGFLAQVAVMAVVTYLIRAVPLVLCRGQLRSRWLRDFLFYVPYAVLGAMTFPAIFYSTDGYPEAAAGTAVALILAFRRKGLLVVAVGACIAAFLVKVVLLYV